ncbi:MAG: DJ-1/PfpI family protein [Clostridia bacterium]|nr:DJ-1/PfpI family protein [Clostridia bacterium]
MLYMFLADGFEETEAIGTLDVIRRAGIRVNTVSITGGAVCGSHDVLMITDAETEDIVFENMTGIILPGGMPGTLRLQGDKTVKEVIKFCHENGLLIAAICAAPMILGEMGILEGKEAVCYPGFEEYLKGAIIKPDLCVADENIITAKGAGASMLFGAKIVDYFKPGEGQNILEQMQHA